ncbi:MAG: hypothetical protein C9356_06325 [Oleiphilus sp.]|nr:MAG: hypothetical protein C9356_06325 [Oleiphilus sp.]
MFRPWIYSLKLPYPARFPLLFLILASCLSTFSFAARVSGLYTATVSVESQGESSRNDALAQGLEQVLVKVSGDEAALANSGARQLLASPEKFVVAFSYRENPDYIKAAAAANASDPEELQSSVQEPAFLEETHAESDPAENALVSDANALLPELPPPFLLDVSFAQSSVERALASYGVPIWGATRPSMLVWLVEERQGERRLLGASDPGYVEDLKREAEKRSLPVYFPVVDLADLSSVDLNALWGLYPEAVSDAAQRYQPDLNVLIRLNALPLEPDVATNFSADWSMRLKGLDYAGTASGVTVSQLWQDLLSQVSVELAARYAVQQSLDMQSEWLNIEVDQVNHFEDYARLQNYLQSLPSVGRIELQWVKGARLAYRLKLKGQREQFFEYVELGGRLKWIATVDGLNGHSGMVFEDTSQTVAVEQSLGPAAEHFRWIGQKPSKAL